MTDTRERIVRAFAIVAKGEPDPLLSAAVGAIERLEQRVAALEALTALHATPCLVCGTPCCTVEGCTAHPDTCEVTGGWVCSDACWVKVAQGHGGRERQGPEAETAPPEATPPGVAVSAGPAPVQPAPAPEPSEEAADAAREAALAYLVHPGDGLVAEPMEETREGLRAAYAVDVPRLEREAGERMVRRFVTWLAPHLLCDLNPLAERFLKEGT